MHSKQNKYIFGLDIGVNSIGWAVLECELKKEKLGAAPRIVALADLNSYIFESGVDEKGVPRNAIRREKRLMRRQYARRAGRRRALVALLKEHKLLPQEWNSESKDNPSLANKIDANFAARVKESGEMPLGDDVVKWASPFAMRHFGLTHDLMLHEIGRVCMHLQRNRGYFCNRGAKYLKLLRYLKISDFGNADEHGCAGDGGGEPCKNGDAMSAEEKAHKEEMGKVLGGIEEFRDTMRRDNNCLTLGQYAWLCPRDGQVTRIAKGFTLREHGSTPKKPAWVERIGHYAHREMVEHEFDELRKQWGGVGKLSDAVLDEIRCKIFEQLPVQSPPPKSKRLPNLRYNAVGDCGIFRGKQRAMKARLEAQEFRTRAVIANITTDDKERNLLFAETDPSTSEKGLNKDGRLSWERVRVILGRHVNYPDDKDIKSGLVGNRTAQSIIECVDLDVWGQMARNEYEATGERMQRTIESLKNRELDQRYALVEDLLSYTCKLGLYKRLIDHWKFSIGEKGVAFKLAILELESGYMKDSSKAIGRMLRYMRTSVGEGMCNEHEARKKILPPEKNGGDNCPSPSGEDAVRRVLTGKGLPNIANPRVERALFASLRVINALIKKYGEPYEIRIEMARDMKSSKKHRIEIERDHVARRKYNVKADSELREYAARGNGGVIVKVGGSGSRISREALKKYKMWDYEQDRQCVYCGTSISLDVLFQHGVEVDHIFPQVFFAQSYANTVVSCKDCNQAKGRNTPYLAFRGDTVKWNGIKSRVGGSKEGEQAMPNLPYAKRKRILNESDVFTSNEDFVERALQDTQYTITVAARYLREAGMRVQASRGQATSILRREWGLDDILPRDTGSQDVVVDDHGYTKYNRGSVKAPKNRRDHRHHAVDAFVVAMTDCNVLMNLIKYAQCKQDAAREECSVEKKRLYAKADKLLLAARGNGGIIDTVAEKIHHKVVPHQKMPRVRGALHKDSFYGRGLYDAGTVTISSIDGVTKLLPPYGDDHGDHVADAGVWDKLQVWKHQRTENKTPLPDELKRVRIKRLYCVIRKPLKVAVATICKTQKIGPVPRIADANMLCILQAWARKNRLSETSGGKDIEVALEADPPRMPSGKNGGGNLIRAVKMATYRGADAVCKVHGFHSVETQNNSHVEVFRHKDDAGRYRGRIVSAITVAARSSRESVNRITDASWGKGWKWAFSLSKNEAVYFDVNNQVSTTMSDKIQAHKEEFGSSVYRVQKMSQRSVFFRHCLVSGVDGDHGLLIVGIGGLNCVKINMDVLGNIHR